MKTTKIMIPLMLCIISFSSSFAQSSEKKETNLKTDTLKVFGKCNMCKETIEASLKKKDGVKSKDWNMTTKILTVTYNPDVITLDDIHHKVANVGYDTYKVKAPDNAYNKLDNCCKYPRPEK